MSTETWSSRFTFLLATAGAAVGLGNLWRFPFIAGENGGGAFVLLYLGFVLLFGVPIMIAEMAIGRRGGDSPIQSLRNLARHEGVSPHWQWIGRLSIFIPIVGLSFYSVVGGWAMAYVLKAGLGEFASFDVPQSQASFEQLLAAPFTMIICHGLFIGSACLLVGRGLHHGIEWVGKYMMPALFVLLLVLVGNSVLNADIDAGLRFLFAPDFSRLTPTVILMALGQAFFSLAVGVGVLMTYCAYLPESVSIPRSAAGIALIDTLVALLAGVAIFPLVFSYGLSPSGGPGLIFITLPVAFGQMPGGAVLGFLFFVLLYFAAFSTAVGMLEPVVSWLQHYRNLGRARMTVAAGLFAWTLGLAAVFSFNVWDQLFLLDFVPLLQGKTIFDLLDFLTSNLLIPLNGMLIALFVGWALPTSVLTAELDWDSRAVLDSWRWILRYVVPVAILMILYSSLSG